MNCFKDLYLSSSMSGRMSTGLPSVFPPLLTFPAFFCTRQKPCQVANRHKTEALERSLSAYRTKMISILAKDPAYRTKMFCVLRFLKKPMRDCVRKGDLDEEAKYSKATQEPNSRIIQWFNQG
jgi:hypothetical protein